VGLTSSLILAAGIGSAGFIYMARRVSEVADYAIKSDFSRAITNPEHIYPVSMPAFVPLEKDRSTGGTLSEGDWLKMEPGQAALLTTGTEDTIVTMRVMRSNDEGGGELRAGTRISISLKVLQQIDSEFRSNQR
jgi:hypothetical protein